MNISPTAAVLAACALIGACELQPAATFVANGNDSAVLGLTDDRGACTAPARLGYLTWWDGATVNGCWVRDHGVIRMRFDTLDDRRIPVGEFRPTEVAADRHLTLD